MAFPRRLCSILTFGLCLTSAVWAAADAGFSATLTEEERKETGIDRMTPSQVASLDNLVQRELILAKQGDSPGFAGDFSRRRSLPERAKAGIDKLAPGERARLDALVARSLAHQPRPLPSTLQPVKAEAAVAGVGPKPIVHGSVTVSVGAGSGGRSFYGGQVQLEQIDPVRGYGVAVAYAEYHGRGLMPYDEFGYGWGYPWGPVPCSLRSSALFRPGCR